MRWCGNEAGHTRESEWSVVPAIMKDNERIQKKSQQADDRGFSQRIDSSQEDIGSRLILAQTDYVIWYPAEVNISIRPGWFYHADEDNQVKSVDTLVDLYERTVGGNATFLLNLAPDQRGLIPERDRKNLQLMGERLRRIYGKNLAERANVLPMSVDAVENMLVLELDLGEEQMFDRIVLQEDIRFGQRVESFEVLCKEDGKWLQVYVGTTVGYKRICRLEKGYEARYLRFRMIEARLEPLISFIGLYHSI